jgi:hypothetical protein
LPRFGTWKSITAIIKPDIKMESQSNKFSVATCKFLGLKTDPRSLASYPSGANCCYGCTPESTPSLAHQREFCLSDNHKNCPVFSADNLTHMPEEYTLKSNGKTKGGFGFWPAIIAIGILLGLVASAILALPNLLPERADSVWSTPTPPLPSPVVSTNSARATTASAEPTPTSTIEPSPIPEIILLPLQTELGTEYKVIIHRTARGDNLSSLAEMHGSWDQAILDATYNLVPPITAGKLIVIPVNNRNWQDQPPLEPYQITQPAISLDDLAQILGVDVTLLIYYNGYEGYLIQQGSWVVIPRAP